MVTVHRAFGFRFVIFPNDHDPPHVHVVGQNGEAKINLQGTKGVSLEWTAGINRNDLRKLLVEAERVQQLLIDAWSKMHGR